jgi:ATP-dependent DNA helicase Rep
MLGMETRGLNITTFHSLGLKILKEEAEHLGYKKNFSILDSADSAKIISDNFVTTDKSIIKSLQNQISLWKNTFITPEYLMSIAKDAVEMERAKIFRQYQDTLRSS